jgi:membrane-bound lytic murein transglycosylase C
MFIKLILKGITVISLLITTLQAQTFDEYLKGFSNSHQEYKNNLEKEFTAYKKAYEEAYKEYTKEIEEKWPQPETSTKHKWVEYSKDYNSKKSIDYEKEEVSLEVIAKDAKEAKEKIGKLFDKLTTYTISDGVKNDILEQKISKKLQKTPSKEKINQKILMDAISKKQKEQIKKKFLEKKLVKVKHKGRFIYKANVKLPSDFTIKKAKKYQNMVKKQSRSVDMPAELIYAIMHSESSFNPLARSHIPAFGLMQIVPRSAGVDTYRHLYGKKKVLSSQYLYNPNNNILIGSNYLHILYFKYLKHIKNPQSRMYCTIAAYNTGAGNVSKAFIGSTNIKRASGVINNMSSQDVYTTLMKKLPYNETKKYLVKVNNRVSAYAQVIQKGQL